MIRAFSGDKYLGEDFRKLVKKFNIKNIVETGTSRGDTTKEFSKMVKNIYTIESVKKTYISSKETLKEFKNVNVYYGSSPDVLRKILPSIKGNTLFFLDAHWGNYWPILDELREISKIPTLSESVLVIHDFYVPEKDFGFDSYYYSESPLELFLKKGIGFFGRLLKMNLIEKQKLDYGFIKEDLDKINANYKYRYNSKVEGSKRGVIFIYP